jgi:hypothetical protein
MRLGTQRNPLNEESVDHGSFCSLNGPNFEKEERMQDGKNNLDPKYKWLSMFLD